MTKTEICNRALALLGHDRAIADLDGRTDAGEYSDQSTEAVRCRQFLDSAIRDVLAESDWDFAAVERTVSAVCPDAFGWVRLPIPPDMIRLCEVTDAEGHPFKTRRNRDFISAKTGGGAAKMRYVTDDVSAADFPHKFNEAVVAQLAFLLCAPMYGDDAKTSSFYQLARSRIADAVNREADETAYRGEWDNPFIRARR